MKFQKGISGNPKGRALGSLNKRTQLSKLLEPHAEKLVNVMVKHALEGDMNAMRLCIERLIPKAQHEHTGIELIPGDASSPKSRDQIVSAVLDGKISAGEAEKLLQMIKAHWGKIAPTEIKITATDPIEAARQYCELMSAS